tara:strand:- start:70 stop:807 length:738 start_codon:yes stop_codon:yes gene_type:complete
MGLPNESKLAKSIEDPTLLNDFAKSGNASVMPDIPPDSMSEYPADAAIFCPAFNAPDINEFDPDTNAPADAMCCENTPTSAPNMSEACVVMVEVKGLLPNTDTKSVGITLVNEGNESTPNDFIVLTIPELKLVTLNALVAADTAGIDATLDMAEVSLDEIPKPPPPNPPSIPADEIICIGENEFPHDINGYLPATTSGDPCILVCPQVSASPTKITGLPSAITDPEPPCVLATQCIAQPGAPQHG